MPPLVRISSAPRGDRPVEASRPVAPGRRRRAAGRRPRRRPRTAAAARAMPFASGRRPVRRAGVPGGTSSLPVLTTATRTRERTGDVDEVGRGERGEVPRREAQARRAAARRRPRCPSPARARSPRHPVRGAISTPPSTSRVSSIGTTASAPRGHGRAGHDRDRRRRPRSGAGSVAAGGDLADDAAAPTGSAREVGGAHGEAVHLRVAEGRQVDRAAHFAGGHAVRGERDRHRLVRRARAAAARSSRMMRGVLLDGDPVHGFSIRGAVSSGAARVDGPRPRVDAAGEVARAREAGRLEPRERRRGADAEVAVHDDRTPPGRVRRSARRARRAGCSPPRAAPRSSTSYGSRTSSSTGRSCDGVAQQGGELARRDRPIGCRCPRRAARGASASRAGSRAYAQLAARAGERVEQDHAADQRLADAGEQLDRLGRHQPADHRADGRQDAGDLARVGLGSRGRRGRGRGSPCRPTRCPTCPDHRSAEPQTSGMPAATAASFAAKRVSFVSEPSIRMSAPASSSAAVAAVNSPRCGDDGRVGRLAAHARRPPSRPSRGRRRRRRAGSAGAGSSHRPGRRRSTVIVPTPGGGQDRQHGAAEPAGADHDGVRAREPLPAPPSPKPGRIR